jgi:hypothetical protein
MSVSMLVHPYLQLRHWKADPKFSADWLEGECYEFLEVTVRGWTYISESGNDNLPPTFRSPLPFSNNIINSFKMNDAELDSILSIYISNYQELSKYTSK